MARSFSIIWLLIISVPAFGQGTIFFNNRTSVGDVRIYLPGSEAGFGSIAGGATAQLYLMPPGGGALIPLLPATTLRTGAASYFVNPVDVTVPNIPAGSSATVILRAWATAEGSNYDSAAIRGESVPLTISALGGINLETGAIVPTPDLAGLQSFQLAPEPSTIALLIVSSAAALLYRRRE